MAPRPTPRSFRRRRSPARSAPPPARRPTSRPRPWSAPRRSPPEGGRCRRERTPPGRCRRRRRKLGRDHLARPRVGSLMPAATSAPTLSAPEPRSSPRRWPWPSAAPSPGHWPTTSSSRARAARSRSPADPPRLVLGRDAGAELHIAAPPDVEEVAITCNAGRVENVRRQPGGGFTARYRPPPERFPQVAIVSALGRGASGPVDGWLAIPLAGQGDARVRGQPGSEVILRIGDRSFGPGRVADDGVALIPVVVPPGVKEGHQGFTALDLEVPETLARPRRPGPAPGPGGSPGGAPLPRLRGRAARRLAAGRAAGGAGHPRHHRAPSARARRLGGDLDAARRARPARNG